MLKKTDPSLTFLNSKGYNVVKVPRAEIVPLEVVGNDGTQNELLGLLSKVWTTPGAARRRSMDRSRLRCCRA